MTDHSPHFDALAGALTAFGIHFTPDPELTEDQTEALMTGALMYCITNAIEDTVAPLGADGVPYVVHGWHGVAEEHQVPHETITGSLSVFTALLHAITVARLGHATQRDTHPRLYDMAAAEALEASSGLLYLAALHDTDMDMLTSLAEFVPDGDAVGARTRVAIRARHILRSALQTLNVAEGTP